MNHTRKKNHKEMTIRELIEQLEATARVAGEDLPVKICDPYEPWLYHNAKVPSVMVDRDFKRVFLLLS